MVAAVHNLIVSSGNRVETTRRIELVAFRRPVSLRIISLDDELAPPVPIRARASAAANV